MLVGMKIQKCSVSYLQVFEKLKLRADDEEWRKWNKFGPGQETHEVQGHCFGVIELRTVDVVQQKLSF